MGQGRLTHIVTHTILTSFSTFSRGKIEKCDLFKEIKNETVAYSVLPKQARYQLRYTRLWNCFICGLSCGLSRFLTNGFAEIVPASDGVPAVCEVGLFPSWMGGIRSQITRAANYATFGHRYFSRPRAFFPTYVRQYTLRSAALALWHHLLLDRGQHDGFILYLSILPVSPPKSSLFASGRYVGKAVRRLWGLRTA